MAKLVWSPHALADLESICEFIARDSERYARLFAARLVDLAEGIPLHPELGPIVPEYRSPELRERRLQNYRMVYRIGVNRIDIVAITHGSKPLPDTPPFE